MSSKPRLYIVAGPTATGKTDFAVKQAQKVDGELINVDSRQIYKYLDIGTNKGKVEPRSKIGETLNLEPSTFNLNNIPIHLISFLEPDKRFSVFDYKKLAELVIQDIVKRGKVPILVGGTGLYIDAILKNYPQDDNTTQEELRTDLEKLSTKELQKLLLTTNYQLLTKLNNSDWNNPRRLIRLIEKNHNTFDLKNKIQISKNKKTLINSFDVTFYYPIYDWETLKTKIESRVELMFEEGLVEETKNVLAMGYPPDSVALQGTGYKEVVRYLQGEISLDECKRLVKISHRQYARRQRTWFEGGGRGYNLEKVKF